MEGLPRPPRSCLAFATPRNSYEFSFNVCSYACRVLSASANLALEPVQNLWIGISTLAIQFGSRLAVDATCISHTSLLPWISYNVTCDGEAPTLLLSIRRYFASRFMLKSYASHFTLVTSSLHASTRLIHAFVDLFTTLLCL